MAGPLTGVTVLEVGAGAGVGYCGRLLAGFGATVVKVEPPEGDAARHARVVLGAPAPEPNAAPQFLYLGAGKRSLVLDLAQPEAQEELRRLAARASVVLSDQPRRSLQALGLDYDRLSALDIRLVSASLTPYGDWGPWSGWRAENINAFAMGGQMALTGELSREPLCTAGAQAWMQLGLHGFAAVCFALYGVALSGVGQHVEVSAAECMAGASEGFGPNARFTGRVVPRSGRARFSMMGIYPCRDGYAGIYGTHRQIPPFARLSGHEELLEPGRFTKLPDVLAAQDELLGIVLDYFDRRTKGEVMDEGRSASMTIAPVHTVREVASSPHLNARGFFVERRLASGRVLKQPGRPFRMSATPWVDGPAPDLGEATPAAASAAFGDKEAAPPAATLVRRDRDHRGLLAGLKVLDFTAYWAGPYATKWLADFGAKVLKVESPASYDFIRSTAVDFNRPRVYDYSAYFNNYSRGKKGLSIDPAHPDGRAVLLELAAQCDLVVENFKAGRMAELGLTYDDFRAVNPRIIVVSISGYGQDGPDHALAGVGTNMEQLSGIASLNAYEDAPQPYNTGIAYGDPTSGTTGAAAIAMALLHRARTGEGQYVEITGQETLVSLIGEEFAARSLGLEPVPSGNRHPDMAPHGCYPCAGDDRWVTLAVRTEAEWQALCALVDAPHLASLDGLEARQASALDIDAAIMAWTLEHSDYEAARALQAAGIAAAPVLHALDLVEDPQFRVRGYFETVTHPDMGPYPHDGVAWRLSRTPGRIETPAPLFGQHTRELLADFGIPTERVEALYASGAAADVPYR
ncbi:MAG: CaiB/BaiF CoA transferase family protein [Dehalococcoidia bacterium]